MTHRTKIINKRANWQLYDKDKNKRVTLNAIRKMIVAGKDVRFIDEVSGDDITVAALSHIIVEKEQSFQRPSGDVLVA